MACLRVRYFKAVLLFALCFLPLLSLSAHEGNEHAVAAVSPAEMYKPTAMPDRIVLSLNGDPRTTHAVSWRTSTEVTKAWAEIVIAEAGPNFSQKSRRVEAESELLVTDINTAHFHRVTFRELQPGVKYAYRLGDGTNWSEWFHFGTAAERNEPFSFIYFGDAQNNLRSLWSRVIREAYSNAPKAAFLLHAGDLINSAEADAEWGEWCGAGAWINAMMPNIAIPGNHEQAKLVGSKPRLSHHWRPQFELPTNGPPGLEETCFTLVYHNLRIIALNSNEQQDIQTAWLEKVLKENESPWVVCTFHHPIFSTGKDRDNPELRAMWKPLFDKYKVDLVLQGHDHTYGRTGLDVPSSQEELVDATTVAAATTSPGSGKAASISQTIANVATGVQRVDSQTGTVYVVSVSGPKMYSNKRPDFMKRLAEDTQLYQIVHVGGDRLRFEARTAIGQLYDAFELHKRTGKINHLVEIDPEVPANLRPLKDE